MKRKIITIAEEEKLRYRVLSCYTSLKSENRAIIKRVVENEMKQHRNKSVFVAYCRKVNKVLKGEGHLFGIPLNHLMQYLEEEIPSTNYSNLV